MKNQPRIYTPVDDIVLIILMLAAVLVIGFLLGVDILGWIVHTINSLY